MTQATPKQTPRAAAPITVRTGIRAGGETMQHSQAVTKPLSVRTAS
jgi:hypothetical protein